MAEETAPLRAPHGAPSLAYSPSGAHTGTEQRAEPWTGPGTVRRQGPGIPHPDNAWLDCRLEFQRSKFLPSFVAENDPV